MKKKYYCKQNAFFYVVFGLATLIPLILSALSHKDYFSVDYVTVYISIVFLIIGALVFALSSAHVSLSKDNIVFCIVGIPFKYISIQSMSEIKNAVKPQFHLFALSKEQISISHDNNRVINLSLYNNDDFMHQVKKLKASEGLSQVENTSVWLMRFIRFVLILLYFTANALLPLGINIVMVNPPLFLAMMSMANIICLAYFVNTRQKCSL